MTGRKIAFLVPQWKQPVICRRTNRPCSCRDSACKCQTQTACDEKEGKVE